MKIKLKHNAILCCQKLIPIKRNKTNLPIWFWSPGKGKHNFGDTLFYELVKRILGIDSLRIASDFDITKPRFIPGGSTLHHCRENDVVWGVGINNPLLHKYRLFPKAIDIRSVRGPITASFVKHTLGHNFPKVSSDPALLVPKYFPEIKVERKTHSFGHVPHFSHFDINKIYRNDDILYINPMRHPFDVIKDILRCEKIVSSSLHGIIIAEAYGIPARWLYSKNSSPAHIKYYDYYLSTDRAPRPIDNIEGLNRIQGEPLPSLNLDILLGTFPWDIYEK